jgi:hypothetical protein
LKEGPRRDQSPKQIWEAQVGKEAETRLSPEFRAPGRADLNQAAEEKQGDWC